MIYSIQGKNPSIHSSVYLAPGSRIIGDVHIAADSSIWFNAVLRGDEGAIRIGQRSNIQDNSTCHLYAGYPLMIGNDVTVGHNVIVHGCRIGNNCLIGMGSILLDDVEIGENCLIAAHTLIPPGKKIPPNSFVMGSPGKIVREVTEKDLAMIKEASQVYVENGKKFRAEEAAQKASE
ncbi:gamma carbonic anhydrase family protein [Bacillus horti]|uniref:Carbonic anhydrase/acetyltransferase-like protein (Isoleucine patch superfamily) n=1 Tax=Caldalkalibacillus horti TaxID=77523 RepID=A0ABT9W0F2_9BACI|nr:gamma carbonic anhydrase family protein [Bacillus horti]MDQ0166733.1 carbonic anhydrase/acetyltransferase-like protein (isoleucine patch superfamily) [Bacillus horti]